MGLDNNDQAAVIGKSDQNGEALPVSELRAWLKDELEPAFWENILSCLKPSSRGFNRFPSAICLHGWLPSVLKMFFLLQVYIFLPRRVKLQLQILPICDKENPKIQLHLIPVRKKAYVGCSLQLGFTAVAAGLHSYFKEVMDFPSDAANSSRAPEGNGKAIWLPIARLDWLEGVHRVKGWVVIIHAVAVILFFSYCFQRTLTWVLVIGAAQPASQDWGKVAA